MTANPDEIHDEVWRRRYELDFVQEDWFTPNGNRRSMPMLVAGVSNTYLQEHEVVKAKDRKTLDDKARKKLDQWAKREVQQRVAGTAQAASEQAEEQIEAIRNILSATLQVDDRLDWEELLDRRTFPEFHFPDPPPDQPQMPDPPPMPPKPFWSWLIPSLKRKWLAQCEEHKAAHQAHCEELQAEYERKLHGWEVRKQSEWERHEKEKHRLYVAQKEHNDKIADFRKRFEDGETEAVEEYIDAVFERSVYPEGFYVDQRARFDPNSQTVVVELQLPAPGDVPDIVGYKHVKSRNEIQPIRLKKKEHTAMYDDAVKQATLRTIHEVFEAVYVPHVQTVVVNGWVQHVDPATGTDESTYIVSVSADREQFETFNLARVDPGECIKALKGLMAGSLADVAPVQPILQFDREERRFVDSKEILDEVGSGYNLSEMPWEDFEHLVRELFGKMFSGAFDAREN